MNGASKTWAAALVFCAVPAACWANFGFAPAAGQTCLVALESDGGTPGPFFWAYKGRTPPRPKDWTRVRRDPEFREKYARLYFDRKALLKSIESRPPSPPPESLSKIEEPCLRTWTRYWEYITRTSDDADPAKRGPFLFDPAAAAAGMINVGDLGSGFYVSKSGLFITNYHVAKFFCDIPKRGDPHASIRCGKGFTLHAYPDWEAYVDGQDYALMGVKRAPKGIEPLTIRADLPRRWERVFLAGFPTESYSSDYAERMARLAPYPSRNSGKSGLLGFLKKDPLVFSTGRLTSILDRTKIFPNARPSISLATDRGTGASPPHFTIQEWDQSLDVLITDVPSGPGSSGSPLLDKQGRVLGILHRSNMYYSALTMIGVLDMCNSAGSSDPLRRELAARLTGQGHCPAPSPRPSPEIGQARARIEKVLRGFRAAGM